MKQTAITYVIATMIYMTSVMWYATYVWFDFYYEKIGQLLDIFDI